MKGVYVLLIEVKKATTARIGALGEVKFDKGTYAYVGSAQNSVEKRVARHMSKHKKLRWHIDYLLNSRNANAMKAFCKKSGKAEECRIARKLAMTEPPIPGFGCSDCRCGLHLFRILHVSRLTGIGMNKMEA